MLLAQDPSAATATGMVVVIGLGLIGISLWVGRSDKVAGAQMISGVVVTGIGLTVLYGSEPPSGAGLAVVWLGAAFLIRGGLRAEGSEWAADLRPAVGQVLTSIPHEQHGSVRSLSGNYGGFPVEIWMASTSNDGSTPPLYLAKVGLGRSYGRRWSAHCGCKRARSSSPSPNWYVATPDPALQRRLQEAGVRELCARAPTSAGGHPTVERRSWPRRARITYSLSVGVDFSKRLTASDVEAQLRLLVQLAEIDQRVNRTVV